MLTFLPFDNKSVYVRNLDLVDALSASDVDYLVILSRPNPTVRIGQPWTYQIEAISRSGGLTYSLQLGPSDMTLSDTGLMRWTPPVMAPGLVRVIVSVSDASEEQSFHQFELNVVGYEDDS